MVLMLVILIVPLIFWLLLPEFGKFVSIRQVCSWFFNIVFLSFNLLINSPFSVWFTVWSTASGLNLLTFKFNSSIFYLNPSLKCSSIFKFNIFCFTFIDFFYIIIRNFVILKTKYTVNKLFFTDFNKPPFSIISFLVQFY